MIPTQEEIAIQGKQNSKALVTWQWVMDSARKSSSWELGRKLIYLQDPHAPGSQMFCFQG